ncbi:hypothetical protein EYZ11_000364 [Aspergillus tanneri]|nr:hypothetical protein EYZ11_000364 [Aspergillus tanneri]
MREDQTPRIVTITGRAIHLSVPENLDPCALDVADLLVEDVTTLQLCGLAAQSPMSSPDFIVLAMSRMILHDQFWGTLASTLSLLEQRYSVTQRPASLSGPEQYGERSSLPPMPCKTTVDCDTFADLPVTHRLDRQLEANTEIPSSGPDSPHLAQSGLEDKTFYGQSQSTGPPGCNHHLLNYWGIFERKPGLSRSACIGSLDNS